MPHYNDCQYLYLSNAQATKSAGGAEWQNLPTLSLSSRECYITLVKINVLFGSSQSHNDIIVKGSLPTMNYKSSDNSEPVIAVLHSDDDKIFDLNIENPIHLFSNDNIRNFKIALTTTAGVATAAPTSCNLLLKIEYVNQSEQQESFLSELPKRI
tara:strand:- start:19 stop:483 length:465 start_codon:yes stop_codon:yes gene_type:complete